MIVPRSCFSCWARCFEVAAALNIITPEIAESEIVSVSYKILGRFYLNIHTMGCLENEAAANPLISAPLYTSYICTYAVGF